VISMNTVADILGVHDLIAFCSDCDHKGKVPIEKLDPGLVLTSLYARLRCSACRSSNTSIRLVYNLPDGETR